jgi:transketolase
MRPRCYVASPLGFTAAGRLWNDQVLLPALREVVDPVDPWALGVAAAEPSREDWLDTFGHEGSCLAEQPAPFCAPGVELATGSLGHGLPVAIGLAMGARIRGIEHKIVVAMSDGECNEGSVWEAAMFAPAQKLGSLCVVVDYNKWQATGRSNEIMAMESLAAKWTAFGWNTSEVDGHDIDALTRAMQQIGRDHRPIAIVAHTVKGKGVSFMEDDNNWHYRIPKAEEVTAAKRELGLV